MTAKQYKIRDLRRWNRVQLVAMEDLHVPPEPDQVAAFGEWFSSLVDDLGRLPRWEEIHALSPKFFSN